MNPMDEAELMLEQVNRNMLKFTWQKTTTETEKMTTFTGRTGTALVVVLAFEVPVDLQRACYTERMYDGVVMAGSAVARMPRDMAKRFFNVAATKLNGRKSRR